MQSKAQYITTQDEKDDAVSEFFVNTGFKLSETMQECPSVYHCLNALDQEWGFKNPLNRIHKISFCLKADCRPEALTWLFESILDATRSGQKFITESTLQQFRSGKGGNIPTLMIMKQDLSHTGDHGRILMM